MSQPGDPTNDDRTFEDHERERDNPWTGVFDKVGDKDGSAHILSTLAKPSGMTPEAKEDLKAAALGLLLSIPSTFLSAYVGKQMWNWFVPIVYKDAPEITGLEAVAIGGVIQVFKPWPASVKETAGLVDEKYTFEMVLKAALYSNLKLLLNLGTGAVVKRLLDRKN